MSKAIEALSEMRKSLNGNEVTVELRDKVLSVLDATIQTLSEEEEERQASEDASKDEQLDTVKESLSQKREELSEKNRLITSLSDKVAELEKKLEEYAVKEKQDRVNSLLDKEIKAGVTKAEDKEARYSELMEKDLTILSEVEKVVAPLVKLSTRQSLPSGGKVELSDDKLSDTIVFNTNGDVSSKDY